MKGMFIRHFLAMGIAVVGLAAGVVLGVTVGWKTGVTVGVIIVGLAILFAVANMIQAFRHPNQF